MEKQAMSSWKTSGKVRLLGTGAIGIFSWDGKARLPGDSPFGEFAAVCHLSITAIPDLIPDDLQENKNIQVWEGSVRIIESNSWPCTPTTPIIPP